MRSLMTRTLLGVNFKHLAVVSESLRLAKLRWPDEKDIDRAGPLLKPTEPFHSLHNVHLFALHCREILERFVAGADTRPGTDAEIVATLCLRCLNEPLDEPNLYTYMVTALTLGVMDDDHDLELDVQRTLTAMTNQRGPFLPAEATRICDDMRDELRQDWRIQEKHA